MTCGFVPPYLLQRLAGSDDAHLVACGDHALQADAEIRSRRARMLQDHSPARAAVGSVQVTGKRLVHDAHNGQDLPGEPVRGDDDPATEDPSVDEAHASSGQAWDLFADEFGRQSYDGNGTTTVVTVHYGRGYDNAFWDGRQLVFGDGDGRIFGRFTKPMDVMVHEFTHGVIQFSAALVYRGQSGALNESLADVFAAMAKQRLLSQTADQADWLVGAGLFMPGINARALRSMIEPGTAYDDPQLGKDPQPATMAGFVVTEEDNGGVHVNSGIPNRAFAVAAIATGGPSWERVGRVWYDTLTGGRIPADIDFVGFAAATVESASRLFPDQPAVADSVRSGWQQVGVFPGSAPVDLAAGGARPTAGRVAVRRSGGIAGMVQTGELDLADDPDGPEVQRLLRRVNFATLTASEAMPDRFVYTVDYAAADADRVHVTVFEHDLTPELSRVVEIVLRSNPGAPDPQVRPDRG